MGTEVRGKVLLTGGSGFIASHILDVLLDQNFEVVVTARSHEKGQRIVSSIEGPLAKNVSFVVVNDVAKDGAFDDAVRADPPFDYVIHTASPYHFNVQDPERDFLDPAIRGTKGILNAVKVGAPAVKRVVITSSSAAMLNPTNHAKVYDESFWAPMTWEEALKPQNTYRASKVFSERAAWDFVESEKPHFDLAVINNTYTFGPIPRHLPHLSAMNTSNHRIRDIVQGKMRDIIEPTAPVFTFVDVRDVALAHVRAMTIPEAGGHRFYTVGGYFSNKRLADIIRTFYPELEDRLPPVEAADDFPDEVYGFNNTRSKEILGLEYTGLDASVRDTVQSILKSGLDQ
ncbi:NAD(P)-binding protein [Thozetella sp. PMI_491]|nr:NAD(P)-binding protein [Thozetella sp. PMI_491]